MEKVSVKNHEAFTIEFEGLTQDIILSTGISVPFDVDSKAPRPKPHYTSALWDTGSSHSMIKAELAKQLQLQPVDVATVFHPKGRSDEQNVYLACLYLPNNTCVDVEVTECHSVYPNFDIIIGMEIITLGDMAISNVGGKTTFSFRMPSQGTTDFCQK